MNATIDTSVLNERIHALQSAMRGAGAGHDGISGMLANQGGQLAWEIGRQLGPKTKAESKTAVDSNLKSQVTARPFHRNLTGSKAFSTYGAWTWIQAGPRSILGVNDVDDHLDASTTEALSLYYAARKSRPARGKAYIQLGKRGKQHVMFGNRMRVTKAVFAEMNAVISAKVGQMRASFARAASELAPRKPIPAWIRQQFSTVTVNGKSLLNSVGLNDRIAPVLEFGSRAKGVESNPHVRDKIQRAIIARGHIVASTVKKVLDGWTYDWNTGAVFRRPPTENN